MLKMHDCRKFEDDIGVSMFNLSKKHFDDSMRCLNFTLNPKTGKTNWSRSILSMESKKIRESQGLHKALLLLQIKKLRW